MSDVMRVQPFAVLLTRILREWDGSQSIFGIHRSLFYTPRPDSPYATHMFGCHLATPIGPAAGPHTQLAQNILCAWLSGGRFIELKTVQVMDELEIPRPCIDMEDEGYNVEWSQELRLEQSAGEYIKAWVLIHVLRRLLGFEGRVPFGTIFNMSVGYNLEGIQSPPMQRFMDRLQNPAEDLAAIQHILETQFPQFTDLPIPNHPITNNVTLSTMHGCPPDEIERIARYLMEERGLHTTVKLNPTLLGKEAVMHILHDHLGFTEIHIPDRVFEHDLQYDRAVELITRLQQVAAQRGLTFGVKLSNTLAMANHKGVLPGDEMYMSGRALYPITIKLFHKLAQEFDGRLNVSYSAGADALNVTTILACGARPVTAVSDLLKPGGYSRLLQYLENLEREMQARGATSLEELARDGLANLERAAAEALQNRRYKKSYFPYGLPKVESGLGLFDCITAPCVAQCAVGQDVPAYAWLIAQGEYERALEVILARNPLPGVTGYVCTHLCQTRCTRNNTDEPVAIRALKRFAAEWGDQETRRAGGQETGGKRQAASMVEPLFVTPSPPLRVSESASAQVAVIGAGPSGLSAAYFLALNGVQVVVFEAKDMAGGMMRLIPSFRLPEAIIQQDIERIARLGVEIKLSHPLTRPPETLLQEGFDAVYIACGFQKGSRLDIEGIEGEGVFMAFDLLERTRRGEQVNLGARALVIGGGDTAMDAARVAQRLTGQPATIVYRRSRQEMPASAEEVAGLLEEGNLLLELATPVRVIRRAGRVVALECLRNRLGEPGKDGRRLPIPIEGSEFRIEADSIIVAIGQRPDLAFLDGSRVTVRRDGAIAADPICGLAGVEGIYAGGDCVEGPASIIAACADGRRAAEAICAQLGIQFTPPLAPLTPSTSLRTSPTLSQGEREVSLSEEDILRVKRVRARREPQHGPEMVPPAQRRGFELIEATLTAEAAQAEARRCVQCAAFCDKCAEVCPNRANTTYFVSPVSLTLPVLSCHGGLLAVSGTEVFRLEQPRQIIHVSDFCNECGNCATFCVHQGRPYAEKPRLFLDRSDFEREENNAFRIEGNTIRRRQGGRESQLSFKDGTMVFENAWLRVTLSPAFDLRDMVLKEPFEGILSLKEAAEMAVILEGVSRSLSFLLAI
ncbi:MAG: putative selenate reductase subunit YgfK [Anaerolineae bacterium]|nr:putative selenate reductase subunit YgfK [Anaerolineae bacterium]